MRFGLRIHEYVYFRSGFVRAKALFTLCVLIEHCVCVSGPTIEKLTRNMARLE